jgi:cell division protein FtsW (lipid II flippase)
MPQPSRPPYHPPGDAILMAPSTHLVLAGCLLSALGLGLLIADVASGRGEGSQLLRQALGHVVGAACCAWLMCRRGKAAGPRGPAASLASLALLVWVPTDAPLVDRAVIGQAVRVATVAAVATLLGTRPLAGDGTHAPRGRCVVLVSVVVGLLALVNLFQGRVAPALAVAIVGGVMMRSGGLRRSEAMLPTLALLSCLAVLVWVAVHVPYRAARLEEFVQTSVAARFRPELKPLLAARLARLSNLPSPAVSELVLARVVGEAGYTGAATACGVFAAMAWLGFRRARCAPDLRSRVLLAGATATLVVPVVLHVLGCFLLTGGGLLPFVSYAPLAVAVDWAALGVLAALARDPTAMTA